MAFGAFVGTGFEVAAGGVAAFGVNLVAAESAVGPFKENAGVGMRQRLDCLNAVSAGIGAFPAGKMNVSNHTPSLYRYCN